MTRTWKTVWDARTLDRAKPSVLERLMEADGLDTGFGNVSEASWRRFAIGIGTRVGASAGTRIFEVGCGAGAFLYPLYESGCTVGGLDQSAALIGFAREAMPNGQWTVADAADMASIDRSDIVLACGVFMYFASLEYARQVLAEMTKKAARKVAILDVPDLAKRDAALAFRRGSLGEAEYAARYAGLDHLFYERAWMQQTLVELGARSVVIEDQMVEGYQNAPFRFNAFAEM